MKSSKPWGSPAAPGEASPEPKTLGNLVEMIRKERRWSREALATQALVSTRTIQDLERGRKVTARADAIVRLASALGQNVGEWLALGNQTASPQLIKQEEARASGAKKVRALTLDDVMQDEVTLREFFEQVGKRLERPTLLCVSYSVIPAALNNGELLAQIRQLLSRGMFLALFMPYSGASACDGMNKIHLRLFYKEVGNRIESLAQLLRKGCPKEFQDRVRIYHLAGTSAVLVPPHAEMNIRPMYVVSRSNHASSHHDDEQAELFVWVTNFEGSVDEIRRLYPTKRNPQDREVLYLWRDYFSDVVEPWLDSDGRHWGKILPTSTWANVKL